MLVMSKEKWKPIATAPHNKRIIVKKDCDETQDEIAMAWWDRIDNKFWYSPQGGQLNWKPTHWQNIPS